MWSRRSSQSLAVRSPRAAPSPAVEQMCLWRFDQSFGGVAVPSWQASHQEEPFEHGQIMVHGLPVQAEIVCKPACVQQLRAS